MMGSPDRHHWRTSSLPAERDYDVVVPLDYA
jgi:hypothetical protein